MLTFRPDSQSDFEYGSGALAKEVPGSAPRLLFTVFHGWVVRPAAAAARACRRAAPVVVVAASRGRASRPRRRCLPDRRFVRLLLAPVLQLRRLWPQARTPPGRGLRMTRGEASKHTTREIRVNENAEITVCIPPPRCHPLLNCIRRCGDHPGCTSRESSQLHANGALSLMQVATIAQSAASRPARNIRQNTVDPNRRLETAFGYKQHPGY